MAPLLTGEVDSSSSGCFQWTIDDFLTKILDEESNALQSPDFDFSGATCSIRVRLERKKQQMVLNFYEINNSPSHTLYLKVGTGTEYKWNIGARNEEGDKNVFFHLGVTIQCADLLERICGNLSNQRLTVFCELRLDTEKNMPLRQTISASVKESPDGNRGSEADTEEETLPEYKIVKRLQKDLKDLFDSREDCDVTIKIQDREYPAHSVIMRARSPVFKSMFSHEMVEKLSGSVVIEDCDPGTFPDFLYYLYTGSTHKINVENVCHLYTTSDKYQVEELKEACMEFMKNHLSVDTFCDILTLALRHSETGLIDLSTDFFCLNAKDLTRTAKWQIFLRGNPIVANELFIKALGSNNS